MGVTRPELRATDRLSPLIYWITRMQQPRMAAELLCPPGVIQSSQIDWRFSDFRHLREPAVAMTVVAQRVDNRRLSVVGTIIRDKCVWLNGCIPSAG